MLPISSRPLKRAWPTVHVGETEAHSTSTRFLLYTGNIHSQHKKKHLWLSFLPDDLFGEQTAEVSMRKTFLCWSFKLRKRRISPPTLFQLFYFQEKDKKHNNEVLQTWNQLLRPKKHNPAHSCRGYLGKIHCLVSPTLPMFGYYLRLQLIPDRAPTHRWVVTSRKGGCMAEEGRRWDKPLKVNKWSRKGAKLSYIFNNAGENSVTVNQITK